MSMTFEFVLLVSFTILTILRTSLLWTRDHFFFLKPVTNTNFLDENNKTNLVMHLFLELNKVIGRNFNIFQKHDCTGDMNIKYLNYVCIPIVLC